MSVHSSNILATNDNFNLTDIDLENNGVNNDVESDVQQQNEIINIGEFVFNHITAESNGSFIGTLRRKVAIYSKWLIKTWTIADVIIYISFLFLSLFLLVQKNTIIALKLNWIIYASLVATFLNGIVCIWILKLVIEAGYEHRIYLTYLIYRILSICVIMLIVLVKSVDHLNDPPRDLSSTKSDILFYYLVTTMACSVCITIYIAWSSIVYLLHLSIVKEFYKIVTIIVESQAQYAKMKKELDIGQGIPEYSVGMPYIEDPKIIKEMSDETYALSLKHTKFEVEIELEDGANWENKIKVFQWQSESSDCDSYRISPIPDKLLKKKSEKIVKGRINSLQDDDFFSRGRKISENVHTKHLEKAIALHESDPIDEEASDKYGLDYLEEYQRNKESIVERHTAFTSEGEMVASPISKLSMKKKVSVKHVTKKKSFSSSKMIKARSFVISEIDET